MWEDVGKTMERMRNIVGCEEHLGERIRKSGDVREHLEVVHVFDLNIMK